MFRGRARRLHFIGIGGIGMSGIAEVLLTLKYEVHGSDLKASEATERLEKLGARIAIGHDAHHLDDADVVIISSAVKFDNPEVVEARRRGIPVIPRAEMLAELMRLKYGIAVAGSHGKTTTTSLIATILDHGGIDPTTVIGGRLKSMGSNARLGEGEYLVAEADESDGSFLRLMPTLAVVTNIDAEHLDHWQGGIEQIIDAFVDFTNKTPFYGLAVLCLDHPNVQGMLPKIDKRYLTYGLSAQADYRAENIHVEDGRVIFDVFFGEEKRGTVRLNMIGRHNVLNALAAIAVAEEVGVSFATCAEALEAFAGIGRRFEIKGEVNDILVVDDYGHHPAEIVATLEAAREAYNRRIIVAFQPHRYTRTRDLLDDFVGAFNACDALLISDIYAAGEDPIEGISAENLAEAIRIHGHHHVRAVGPRSAVAPALEEIVQPGDLVITLGAGSIWQASDELLAALDTGAASTNDNGTKKEKV